MTDRTLTAARRSHPSGATVVVVTGELDHHTARELTGAIGETPFGADAPVVIDLTGLTYCDSTGITVLVGAYTRAKKADSQLILAGLNADLMHVFHIVGLDQLFHFEPTVEQAINALHP